LEKKGEGRETIKSLWRGKKGRRGGRHVWSNCSSSLIKIQHRKGGEEREASMMGRLAVFGKKKEEREKTTTEDF